MKNPDITFELSLDVSVEEAWKLWNDSRKLATWLTTEADVEPELGGAYELFWDPTNHKDNSTRGCKITALVPNKLLAFQWRGPVSFADLMNIEPFLLLTPTAVSSFCWQSFGGENVANSKCS